MFEEVIAKLGKLEVGTEIIGTSGSVPVAEEKYISLVETENKAVFVDGGNAPIFMSPSARVEFVRLCALKYKGKKRESVLRKEGIVLVQRMGNGRIEVTGYGVDISFSVSELDEELRIGKEIVSLERVANLARFILECEFLAEQEGLLVRDGILEAANIHESKVLQKLRNVCGFAKTHSFLTNTGAGINSLLKKEGKWAYPLGNDVYVVKLDESKYLFRLDCRGDVGAVAGYLSQFSDPVFPGYPYPLVLADQLARVSNTEKESLMMRFEAESGSLSKKLSAMAAGSDAHSVLDSI